MRQSQLPVIPVERLPRSLAGDQWIGRREKVEGAPGEQAETAFSAQNQLGMEWTWDKVVAPATTERRGGGWRMRRRKSRHVAMGRRRRAGDAGPPGKASAKRKPQNASQTSREPCSPTPRAGLGQSGPLLRLQRTSISRMHVASSKTCATTVSVSLFPRSTPIAEACDSRGNRAQSTAFDATKN